MKNVQNAHSTHNLIRMKRNEKTASASQLVAIVVAIIRCTSAAVATKWSKKIIIKMQTEQWKLFATMEILVGTGPDTINDQQQETWRDTKRVSCARARAT